MVIAILILYAALMGAWTASFVGCAAYRLPRGQKMDGRSHCESCGHTLSFELVPVLGWLSLGGRCRRCKSRVPAIYPLVEVWLGVVFVCAFLHWGVSLNWLLACIGASCALYVLLRRFYFRSGWPWRVVGVMVLACMVIVMRN